MGYGVSSFTPQRAAQHPRQQSQQETDGSDKKAKGVFMNESVEMFQFRRFQFQCFDLPRLHGVLLMP
jgi:hypothetical protein